MLGTMSGSSTDALGFYLAAIHQAESVLALSCHPSIQGRFDNPQWLKQGPGGYACKGTNQK